MKLFVRLRHLALILIQTPLFLHYHTRLKFLYPGIGDVDAALGALPVPSRADAALGALPVPSSDTIKSTPSPSGSQVAVPFRSTRQN
jgi:hypothetical protein